jgi:hypothetical protein
VNELQKLYSAQQIKTGLEIMVIAIGETTALCCDIEGLLVILPYDDIRLNWRWTAKRGWTDLDGGEEE